MRHGCLPFQKARSAHDPGFDAPIPSLEKKDDGINYRPLSPAIPALVPAAAAGRVKAAVEEEGLPNRELTFDAYDAAVRFGPIRGSYSGVKGIGNADVNGRALVAQLAPDEFLLLGSNANILFAPKLGDGRNRAGYLTVEEGTYRDGKWQRDRLLNGDETYFGLVLPPEGRMLRVKLQKY